MTYDVLSGTLSLYTTTTALLPSGAHHIGHISQLTEDVLPPQPAVDLKNRWLINFARTPIISALSGDTQFIKVTGLERRCGPQWLHDIDDE